MLCATRVVRLARRGRDLLGSEAEVHRIPLHIGVAARDEAFEDKPTRVREANRRVAMGAVEQGVTHGVPVVCECSDPACAEILLLTLTEWRQARTHPGRFVTVPAHVVDGTTLVFKTNAYWLPERQG